MSSQTTPSCATVCAVSDPEHLHLAARDGRSGLSSFTLCCRKWTRRTHHRFNPKDDCQECRERQEELAELPAESEAPDIEPVTLRGKCYDCAQGVLTRVREGFALFSLDGHPSHWYCRYCGSNHVQILNEKGEIVLDQGNLYQEAL